MRKGGQKKYKISDLCILVEKNNRKLENFGKKLRALEKEIGTVQEALGTVQNALGTLQKELRTLREEINERFNSLERDVSDIKWRVSRLEFGYAEIKAENKDLFEKVFNSFEVMSERSELRFETIEKRINNLEVKSQGAGGAVKEPVAAYNADSSSERWNEFKEFLVRFRAQRPPSEDIIAFRKLSYEEAREDFAKSVAKLCPGEPCQCSPHRYLAKLKRIRESQI